jgi:hypothetical protein
MKKERIEEIADFVNNPEVSKEEFMRRNKGRRIGVDDSRVGVIFGVLNYCDSLDYDLQFEDGSEVSLRYCTLERAVVFSEED